MSLKFRSLGTTGTKDLITSYVREHINEIAIAGIMTAILVGITALATGDVMEALARNSHR